MESPNGMPKRNALVVSRATGRTWQTRCVTTVGKTPRNAELESIVRLMRQTRSN